MSPVVIPKTYGYNHPDALKLTLFSMVARLYVWFSQLRGTAYTPSQREDREKASKHRIERDVLDRLRNSLKHKHKRKYFSQIMSAILHRKLVETKIWHEVKRKLKSQSSTIRTENTTQNTGSDLHCIHEKIANDIRGFVNMLAKFVCACV